MLARTKEIAAREHARSMTPDLRDRATGGMPFDEFLRAARKEKPFLVDPYIEDPEELYKWEVDPVLQEVRVAARTKRTRATRAIRAAEDDLGLNREELRRRRWENYSLSGGPTTQSPPASTSAFRQLDPGHEARP